MKKLFTKSAFTTALVCPAQLYYSYDKSYANQSDQNEMLQELAKAGNQIGDLAKLYYGVKPENDLEAIRDYDEAVKRTQELLRQPEVIIAEAAFRSDNLFVRTDLLIKSGNDYQLLEVKSTGWDFANEQATQDIETGTTTPAPKDSVAKKLFDAAFQKYVVQRALKEANTPVASLKAKLLLVDKSAIAGMGGMDLLFQIKKAPDGHCQVVRQPDAEKILELPRILRELDVDKLCDQFIAGTYQWGKKPIHRESELLHGYPNFEEFVRKMADCYCRHEQIWTELSTECFNCPFYATDDTPGKKDGYDECWMHQANFTKEDFKRPLLEELWSADRGALRQKLFQAKKFLLEKVSRQDILDNLSSNARNAVLTPGKILVTAERQMLQIALTTGHVAEILADHLKQRIRDNTYLDREGLRAEMESWTYPLHMIDFETCAPAIPYYQGRHPKEDIAFQFSHHRIDRNPDGSYTITHEGQYLNEAPDKFPNFEFVGELKKQLEQDQGTVFRYADHENTILNHIHQQLAASQEADKDELMAFIETITYDNANHRRGGPRDMVDLQKIVTKYFYHPSMKGSNSIKQVLPAVLKASKFLQEKYSRPIYGTEIHSEVIRPEKPIAWLTRNSNGEIESPYKKLPLVAELAKEIGLPAEQIAALDDDDDEQINNGSVAPIAYRKLRDLGTPSERKQALRTALLRYCELDTMSMVFIWEYFYNEVFS